MNARGTASSTRTLDRAGKAIQRRAAEWLALREAQGFSLTQQADFAEWMAENPRHAVVFAEVESAWQRFDRLASYPHSVDTAPNPDLLAPRRARNRTRMAWAPLALAAAAALAMGGIFWLEPVSGPDADAPATTLTPTDPQFMRLPDGSLVELNAGAVVTEHFTPTQRRLHLVRGEAHFSVTKDPAREFIVEADGVAVRAIGTAFNVRLQGRNVEVLVTEGTVKVAPPATDRPLASSAPAALASPLHAAPSAMLTAGQRTVVPADAGLSIPQIETLAPAEIARALAWQTSRFNFDATPLSEVVKRLNRYSVAVGSAPRLTLHDARLGAVLISGRVRNDNIESFVEALETSFGVIAERRPDGEILLHPADGQPTGSN